MSTHRNLMTVCFAAVFALGLAACSSSSDDPPPPDDTMTEPMPTAYETGKAAIDAATTAADAQAAYDAVDLTAVSGVEAASLRMALDDKLDALATAARAQMQRMALMTAAGGIDTSDLMDAQAIADANTAIAMLEAAIAAAVDVDDTSMYQTMVDNAKAAVMTAQDNLATMGRMMAQRMAISNAVTMARTAVNGVNDDSTDSEVASADSAIAALQTAIDDAVDLPDGDADVAGAQGTLTTLMAQLNTAKTSRQAVLDEAGEAEAKRMAQLGKDMRAALAGPTPATDDALDNIGAPALGTTLDIDAAAGAGSLEDADDPGVVNLAKGDSAGALGSWDGTDYSHMAGTGDAKVTNAARVYTNQGMPTTQDFGDKHTLTDGSLTVADANLGLVMATAFTHSGTQTHQVAARQDAVYVRGTYDGAPGEYSCETGCSSTNDGKGSPSALGGTWTFTPDMGAMTSTPDAHYLYYGWWVSKDSDGKPTAASAFAGRAGTDPGDSTDGLDPAGDFSALTGSATYAGHAAGKFAISNPLTATGNAGHFTADAELKATFSGTNPGVTGTIDNFRLNDGSDDPGWSVALGRGGLGAAGAISAPAAGIDPTVWSIDGNAAPASGTWTGTMYDEAPGDPSATGPGDGSNIPTTVTGTFYSEFSTIGRMVGAFGADKQ